MVCVCLAVCCISVSYTHLDVYKRQGVTCGYVQLGGCIVSKKVAEYFEENVLQCGLTYSGHTLACAAGVAAMKYYKEHDIEGHVAEMHEIVAPFMDEMVKKHKCIGEARCIGCLLYTSGMGFPD